MQTMYALFCVCFIKQNDKVCKQKVRILRGKLKLISNTLQLMATCNLLFCFSSKEGRERGYREGSSDSKRKKVKQTNGKIDRFSLIDNTKRRDKTENQLIKKVCKPTKSKSKKNKMFVQRNVRIRNSRQNTIFYRAGFYKLFSFNGFFLDLIFILW